MVAPATAMVPAEHAAQTDMDAARVSTLYFPTSQLMQLGWLLPSW